MSRRGFTLIELLVVISIIAVLAGMLLPAVGAVRSAAYAAQCSGQMRQIGIAIAIYAERWDGMLPPGRFQSCAPIELGYGVGNSASWCDEAIVGGDIDGPELVDGRFGSLRFSGPWRCPEDRLRQGVVQPDWLSYGLNFSICPYANTAIPAGFWATLTAQSRIRRASAMMLMAETQDPRWYWPKTVVAGWPNLGFYNQETDGVTSWTTPGDHAPGSMWARHRGKANLLFADGHVVPTGDPTAEVAARNWFVRPSDVP